jgi:hypothetical protein
MKFTTTFLALASLFILGPIAAKADTIDIYSFSVPITAIASAGNPFFGHTYTGAFQVNEQTGDVTNFSTNLLGGSYTASDLGNVATFTSGLVTSLHFGLLINAPDGSHSSGFTTGFTSFQIASLGLNPNNYFAYLDPSTFVQGGGTPAFTLQSSTVTPEPSSLILLGTGILGLAGVGRRKFLHA